MRCRARTGGCAANRRSISSSVSRSTCDLNQTSIFADKRALFAFATLCCLLWGSAVPAVKFGYGLIGIVPSDTPSLLLFAGLRFCLAGLMLLAYALLTGRSIAMSAKRTGEVTLLGLGQTTLQYVTYY